MLDLAYELSPALRSFLHVHRSSSYSVRDGGASSAFSSLALACNRSSSSYSPCVEGSPPPPPLPMLPVLVTGPVIATYGMVVTTLPVAQLHVPLLPAAADIAAVATASALAYLSALGGNGSSENTGQIRCGIVRSGGALIRGKHGTPCRGTCCGSRRHAWNGTCCSRHHICGVP